MNWWIFAAWILSLGFCVVFLGVIFMQLAQRAARLEKAAKPLLEEVAALQQAAESEVSYQAPRDNLEDAPEKHLAELASLRQRRSKAKTERQRRLIARLQQQANGED